MGICLCTPVHRSGSGYVDESFRQADSNDDVLAFSSGVLTQPTQLIRLPDHNRSHTKLVLSALPLHQCNFSALSELHQLEALELRDCFIQDANTFKALRPLPNLKKLDIESSGSFSALIQLLQKLPKLEALTIKDGKGSERSIESLQMLCPSLKKIDITNCDVVTYELLSQLAKHRSLEELRIVACENLYGLPDDFFNNLPQLQKLEIVGCAVLRNIVSSKHPGVVARSLKELTISGCPQLQLQSTLSKIPHTVTVTLDPILLAKHERQLGMRLPM